MKTASLLVPILCLLLLTACNQKEGGVSISTGNIFRPVLFQLNDQDADNKVIDMGEFVLTDDPLVLTVKVYNDTAYPYTDFDLAMTAANDEMTAISYRADEAGEIKFPGFEGTCGKKLLPKATCEIKLVFSPRNERIYEEYIELKFKNYIEAESHKTTVKMLAGMPASIVFTNDTTQYVFGELIGTARTPVIERADALVYTEELEVTNAGGLTARNVTLQLAQTCVSTETSLCPTGMGNAYSYTSNCPAALAPREKCNITISYGPKNQDPAVGPVPDDIKEIKYNSTMTMSYIKDPYGAAGGLNAYFRSVSSNIEARFKVSISTLEFEAPVVSGNRDTRTFRINNQGYREGEIKAIAFRDSSGSLVATCGPKDGSLILECRKPDNSIATLEQFPYSVNDRNDCLRSVADGPNYVPVGGGCVFDFIFQPSVLYLVDKPTEFKSWQPEVIYDSRWKGLEVILARKLFNLSAESKAAARLLLTKINYDTTDETSFTEPGPWTVDLGRLTLQSPLYYKRKAMSITFKNIGSVPATDVSLKDGSSTNIPIGGAGANLGPHTPKYYSPVTASAASCAFIDAGSSCTITIQFSPIGLATPEQQDQNMFDYIDPDSYTDPAKKANNYKAFFMTYSTGALFTDTNIDGTTDYPQHTVEAKLKATLVQKGMLMDLSDDPRNKDKWGFGFNAMGDTFRNHFYVTNMGTGTVPYMRAIDPPSDIWNPSAGRNYSTKIIATTDVAGKGAQHDCLDLMDIDFTGALSPTEIPENRVGNFNGLPKDESCVFTVEMKLSDRNRDMNSETCDEVTVLTNLQEGKRFFNRGVEAVDSGKNLWEFCKMSNYATKWGNITINYYDGDNTAPGALSPVYGNKFTINGWTFEGQQGNHAKLIPFSFEPWLSATMWRPSFTLPNLGTGMAKHTPRVIPEFWFYGTSSEFFNLETDPLQTNDFIKAGTSRNIVPTLTAFAGGGSYDYVYYIGSFPQGSPLVTFPMAIKNFGEMMAKVTGIIPNLSTTPVDNAFAITEFPASFPQMVGMGGDLLSSTASTPITFTFNPSVAGEHTMDLTISYKDGSHSDALIYNATVNPINAATENSFDLKVLVVAHVMPTGTHPYLTMDVTDWDVVQNPGAPPTVTQTTTNPAPLTWNFTAPTSTVTLDTIKLTNTPGPNDVYAKKTLTFKNDTAFDIYNFKVLYRGSAPLAAPKTASNSLTVMANPESTCTSDMTLAANTSCKLTFKYQPVNGDTTDLLVLTPIYRTSQDGQYMMQNTSISLQPRSPGQLKVFPFTTNTITINWKATPGSINISKDSYESAIGTNKLDVSPKTWVWDQTIGPNSRIQVANTQGTKASLLLSYHKYLAEHSLRGYTPLLPPGTAVIPAPGEYRNVGGIDYVPIHLKKYANGSTRVLIEGSKGCLFGDDELDGGVLGHQKGLGFNANPLTALNPCYLIMTFNANEEYLQDDIKTIDGDDMRNVASELWYYSVNRSSTASFWLHIKGIINPDHSNMVGTYDSVRSLDTRSIQFTVPKFTANNSAMGTIVGTRVIMATSPSALNDPYNVSLPYVDVKPYDPANPQTVTFNPGGSIVLTNSNYYYFRAVAIRKNNNFLLSYNPCPGTKCRFPGLPAGEFLSASTINTNVKILVPPANHYYFHTPKILVDKNLTGGVLYETYTQSSARCTTRPSAILKSPVAAPYPYKLMSKAAWDLIVATPGTSSYASPTQVSHWLLDPAVSIDLVCAGMPGFVPGNGSQLLDSSSTFYLRSSADPNLPVKQAAGGIPGTPASNYMSYVDGTVGYASARCMVTLP